MSETHELAGRGYGIDADEHQRPGHECLPEGSFTAMVGEVCRRLAWARRKASGARAVEANLRAEALFELAMAVDSATAYLDHVRTHASCATGAGQAAELCQRCGGLGLIYVGCDVCAGDGDIHGCPCPRCLGTGDVCQPCAA